MADVHDPKPTAADDTFHPRDALSGGIRAATLGGAAGLFYSAIGNTLTKENIGSFGVFTRFGGNIGLFGTEIKTGSPTVAIFLTMSQRHVVVHTNSLRAPLRI